MADAKLHGIVLLGDKMLINKIQNPPRITFTAMMLISLLVSTFGVQGGSVVSAKGATPTSNISAPVSGIDLTVEDPIAFDGPNANVTTLYVNDDVDINMTIQNNGDTDSGPFYVNFYVDETTLPAFNSCIQQDNQDYEVLVPGLEAGKTTLLTITYLAGELSLGEHYITVYVDSGCAVTEADENNNVSTNQVFHINDIPVAAPTNDNVDTPDLIAVPYSQDDLDVRGATRDASDPFNISCPPTADILEPGLASVWFTYTPGSDIAVFLDTIGSDYDTYVTVWDGVPGVGDTQLIGCGDDYNNTLVSGLPADLKGGTLYYIEVAEFSINDTNVDAASLPASKTSSDVVGQAGGSDFLHFHINPAIRITGNVGAPGVTLSFQDTSLTRTVTSDSNGDYSIIVPNGWSGIVTPSKLGSIFSPTHKTYTNLTVDQTSQDYTISSIVTILSDGTKDGWILESSETSGKGGKLNQGGSQIFIGDDKSNKQYRGILSFDTTSIPVNAKIISVTLSFKYGGKKGTLPFSTHGKLLADIRKGLFNNNSNLEVGDFQASANKNKALSYSSTQVNSWYSKSLTSRKFKFINRGGVTQFRLRFTQDDNNDHGADFLKIYSGNSPVSTAPQLIIVYTTQ